MKISFPDEGIPPLDGVFIYRLVNIKGIGRLISTDVGFNEPMPFLQLIVTFNAMKIQCWSVGKMHESYIKEGIGDFTKRINKYFSAGWNIIPVPKNAGVLSEKEMKKKEAVSVLEQLGNEDFLVLLDERGTMISSPELATLLQKRANESTRNLVFLIGGAYGVDDSILQRANFKWSLSSLVFPHQLVRLILAEQLYRACTILRNEKYHHT